jgi:hypothetical protein
MISNKILYQRAFNDLFFKFMDEIIQMFSNDHDFIVAKTTFETLKRANPSSIVKAWYKFIAMPFMEENRINIFEGTSDPKNAFTDKNVGESLNVFLFLKSYETNMNKNQIPELNVFFVKLKRELDKIIIIINENQAMELGSPRRSEEDVLRKQNIEKILSIDNYFNKLNKLGASYSM